VSMQACWVGEDVSMGMDKYVEEVTGVESASGSEKSVINPRCVSLPLVRRKRISHDRTTS
jgi:hypothetical protein